MPLQRNSLALYASLLCAGVVACGVTAGGDVHLGPTGCAQWLGLDDRPLAVGSQLAVSFVFSTDAGKTAYAITSSNPNTVAVTDQGDQRLTISVLAPGAATLQLTGSFGTCSRPLVAATPSSITLSDQSHLAAGIDPQLPQSFDLIQNLQQVGQEVIVAVVVDANGDELNSRGLTKGRAGGSLSVQKKEPEEFVLSTLPGTSGTFVAGLADATSENLSYAVALVQSAATVVLQTDDGGLTVLAKALASDGRTEVFGIDDWDFACIPSTSCTWNKIAPAAVRLVLPSSATPQSYTVTVSSASQNGLSAAPLLLP